MKEPLWEEHGYQDLRTEDTAVAHEKTRRRTRRGLGLVAVLAFLLWTLWSVRNGLSGSTRYVFGSGSRGLGKSPEFCPQASPLFPHSPLFDQLGETYASLDFRSRVTDWLSKAVQYKTESYDDMGPPGTDTRYEALVPFQDYLFGAFPEVNKTLDIIRVNTYGLVYVWNGSDTNLKPILLTAHQDVVPVDNETLAEWEHEPYSGYVDGEFVWGRGASDDKGMLIALLASIETLLEEDFKPTRTVVLAFGFDEEVDGKYGAFEIGEYLHGRYGENGFALLIDEGSGYLSQFGQVFALPGVAEKGSVDVQINITSPGGHSSLPPQHTTIGMLAAALVRYEENAWEAHLDRATPVYKMVQCLAEYAPELPEGLKELIRASAFSDDALHKTEEFIFKDPNLRSIASTTQAIDIVRGGTKVNALPEEAYAVVNHRIATDYSFGELKERQTDLLRPLAERFKLSFKAFGKDVPLLHDGPTAGNLTLANFSQPFDPAPYSPTGRDSHAYRVFSGSIRAAYAASHEGASVIVAPSTPPFNTDTKHYWSLTPNIYRYNHGDNDSGSLLNIHTKMEIASLVEMVRFVTTLILNGDEDLEL